MMTMVKKGCEIYAGKIDAKGPMLFFSVDIHRGAVKKLGKPSHVLVEFQGYVARVIEAPDEICSKYTLNLSFSDCN